MTITGTLNVIVNVLVRIENDSVAFERLLEYINENQHEASWESEVGYEPDQEWPQEGKIQLLDYKTQYRPGLDLVLKGKSHLKQWKNMIHGGDGEGYFARLDFKKV